MMSWLPSAHDQCAANCTLGNCEFGRMKGLNVRIITSERNYKASDISQHLADETNSYSRRVEVMWARNTAESASYAYLMIL